MALIPLLVIKDEKKKYINTHTHTHTHIYIYIYIYTRSGENHQKPDLRIATMIKRLNELTEYLNCVIRVIKT